MCLLLMAACSDSDGSLPPKPANVDEYVTAWREVYCSRLVRCGVFADIPTCEAQDRTLPADVDVIAAAQAGIVDWNADVATDCLAALEQRTCDSTTMEDRLWDLPCYGTFIGTRRDGEQCAIGRECSSGECQYLNASCDDSRLCCSGTCNGNGLPPLGMLGDSCRAAPCAEGYCDPVRWICRALKSPGNEFCDSDIECAYGSACIDSDCVPLVGSGEACTQGGYRPCKLIGETCHAPTGTCERGAALGEACTDVTDCGIALSCDDTGHCADLAPRLGESCRLYGYCQAPNLCERMGTDYVCVPPKADGAMCSVDAECDSQRCDLGTSTCTSQPCI